MKPKMNVEAFNKLTDEQLFEGAVECRKSAYSHKHAAVLLANNNEFSIANSHLILGAEEGIKALILFAKLAKIKVDAKPIDLYFRDHTSKHLEAKEMAEAMMLFLLLKQLLFL